MESKKSGKRPSERADELDDELDALEARMGLPPPLPETARAECARFLGLSADELNAMTAEECGEAAYMLEKYGLHAQRAYNRETARVRWAEECVRRVVGPTLHRMPGYGSAERMGAALAENAQAAEIDAIGAEARIRAERLSYLSSRIASMARALVELQQTKRGRRD